MKHTDNELPDTLRHLADEYGLVETPAGYLVFSQNKWDQFCRLIVAKWLGEPQ